LLAQSAATLEGGATITDLTLTGSVVSFLGGEQQTGRISLWARRTAESRIEISLPRGHRTEVRGFSRGAPGCAWAGDDGKLHPAADHNCLTDASWFSPALSSLGDTSASNLYFEDLGNVTESGLTLRHVRTWRTVSRGSARTLAAIAKLSTVDFYLDPGSFLPLIARFNVHPDDDSGEDIPVEVRFADYRNIGGARVPFRIQKLLSGGLQLDITLSDVRLNTGLADTLFVIE
jgi:hypothetical protein